MFDQVLVLSMAFSEGCFEGRASRRSGFKLRQPLTQGYQLAAERVLHLLCIVHTVLITRGIF
jgi:hypothetical protein